MLKVSEIFYSLQGEGTRAGKPCVFIRLSGCNLRCNWCDTAYSLDFIDSKEQTIEQIVDEVGRYDCNFVEITGGEPLLQSECIVLADRLLELHYELAIETNGSFPILELGENVVKIVDIKCPDSGMALHNLYDNINYVTKKDELKFVIASKCDFYWAVSIIEKYRLYDKVDNILFSVVPSDINLSKSDINLSKLAELILSISSKSIKNVVRMQLQYHKIIWDNARGR
jgi:7-carboxy-7-deazaguanine synthase